MPCNIDGFGRVPGTVVDPELRRFLDRLARSPDVWLSGSGLQVGDDGVVEVDAADVSSGVLRIANGGTNSGTALNNNRIMVSASGAIAEAAAMTHGQILVGVTGAAPTVTQIAGTSNQVIVTLGSGSITLSAPQNIHTGASPTFVRMTSSQSTGTAPLTVSSTTVVTNLNADLLDGSHASAFQAADATLTALASYNTNGMLTQTSSDTFAGRTITGTSNEIEVANGDGVSGNPTIGLPDDVTITGNLTVSGTTTTVNTSTLAVEDPLIALATGNDSSDSLDIGFYGLMDVTGSQDVYAGLFRDASDSGRWKLFDLVQEAPTTTVNTSGTGYDHADLQVGALYADDAIYIGGSEIAGTTTEQIQDIVGAMFSGNTETRCSVTYQDGDGTIDVVVDDMTANTNTQNEYATSWVDDSDDVLLRLTESGAGSGTQDLKLVAGSNISLTPSSANMTIAATDTNTQLSTEAVQDIVGAMFSLNTETRIAATYQDGDGTIDLVVDDMTADTNTMGSGFILEDGDGTEVAITENKEIKFIDGGGIDINWSDVDNGTDADPFDLTFTVIDWTSTTENLSTTGTATTGLLTTQVTTDNASVQQGIFKGGNRGTPADGDESYWSFQLDDSAGNQVEFARLTWEANDVTDSTKDGEVRLSVMENNTLTTAVIVDETGLRTFDTALSQSEVGFGNSEVAIHDRQTMSLYGLFDSTSGQQAAFACSANDSASSSSACNTRAVVGQCGTGSSTSHNVTGRLDGLFFQTQHRGSGTVDDAACILVGNGNNTNSGTTTTQVGVYIDRQEKTHVTNGYGIYQWYSGDTNYLEGNLGLGNTAPDTKLHIDGAITLEDDTATPAVPDSAAECRLYMKDDKLIIQYNDGGTARYKYLDLTGTGVTWTHTTSAP